MAPNPDRGSIALFLLGSLLVLGAVLVYPQSTAVTHYTEVTSVEQADARHSERLFRFENLSDRGQEVFIEAKNAVGRTSFEGASNRPDEFNYYDDTAWRAYVEYEGEYYQIFGTRDDCLGLSCIWPYLEVGAMVLVGALAIGYSLKRGIRR